MKNTAWAHRDLIQEVMNSFDPKRVLGDLEKENPSLDGQIEETAVSKRSRGAMGQTHP
jgi:hypothetical protein